MKLSFYSFFIFFFLLGISHSQAQSKGGDCSFVKRGVAIEVPACAGAPATGTVTCETCPSDACQVATITLPSNAVILEVIPVIKRPGYRGKWDSCDSFDGSCLEAQGKNYYAFLEGYKIKKEGAEQTISWKVLNGHNQNNIQARIDVRFALN